MAEPGVADDLAGDEEFEDLGRGVAKTVLMGKTGIEQTPETDPVHEGLQRREPAVGGEPLVRKSDAERALATAPRVDYDPLHHFGDLRGGEFSLRKPNDTSPEAFS